MLPKDGCVSVAAPQLGAVTVVEGGELSVGGAIEEGAIVVQQRGGDGAACLDLPLDGAVGGVDC